MSIPAPTFIRSDAPCTTSSPAARRSATCRWAKKLVAHTYRSAVPLAELLPDTPPWLDEITREMMAKLPCHRPARPLDIYHRLAPHIERELFTTPISADTHHGKAQTTARMDAMRPSSADPNPTAQFSPRRVDSKRVMHLRPADEPPATPTLVMNRAEVAPAPPPADGSTSPETIAPMVVCVRGGRGRTLGRGCPGDLPRADLRPALRNTQDGRDLPRWRALEPLALPHALESGPACEYPRRHALKYSSPDD